MFTLVFWRAVFERGVKTAAQAVVLAITGDVAFNALTADWLTLGGFAAGGLVISVLTSLASAALTDGNPSIGDAEKLAPPVIEERDGRHEADVDPI